MRFAILVITCGCSFENSSRDIPPTIDASEPTVDASIDTSPPARVRRGLVASYTFDEGSGAMVLDRSNVGVAVDLVIPASAPVTWGAGTLTITGETLIASAAPAKKILDGCRDADAITLEAWIAPAMVGGYFPRVATLSENNGSLAVALLAIDGHFELRMYGPMTDTNGLPSLNSVEGTVAVAPIHVVLVSEPGGTRRIYVGGVENVTDTLGGDLAMWGANHRFALANEIDGGRPWLGTFDRVDVYAAALTAAEIATNFDAGP